MGDEAFFDRVVAPSAPTSPLVSTALALISWSTEHSPPPLLLPPAFVITGAGPQRCQVPRVPVPAPPATQGGWVHHTLSPLTLILASAVLPAPRILGLDEKEPSPLPCRTHLPPPPQLEASLPSQRQAPGPLTQPPPPPPASTPVSTASFLFTHLPFLSCLPSYRPTRSRSAWSPTRPASCAASCTASMRSRPCPRSATSTSAYRYAPHETAT